MALEATKLATRFARDERGSIAIMFGISAMAITMFAGIAIDYSRVNHERSRVATSLDAAALAAGKALLDGRLSDGDVETIAKAYFEQNMKAGERFGKINDLAVQVRRSSSGVTLTATVEVPMTLTRIAGVDKLVFPVTSSTAFEQLDIELSMALDITGSMRGRKLDDLKSAANGLVDVLLPDGGTPNKVRIALAPYATAVNLGAFAGAASDNRSTDGCVYERTGAEAYSDAPPQTRAFFQAGGTPMDIDPTEGRYAYACPSATILPLTDDAETIRTSIRNLTANYGTAGHFGAAWAWYMVSEKWRTFWPASSAPDAKDKSKRIKAIILMTDGIFNTSYANGPSAMQALRLCDKMKGTDIDPAKPAKDHDTIVYAIAFQAPAEAEAMLKQCASSSSGTHYFTAANGDELAMAFEAIANQLNNLRLTQ